MEKRLDRAMTNSLWVHISMNAEVKSLEVANSDHGDIFLNHVSFEPHRNHRFRCENSCIFEPECKDIVKK